MMTQQIAESAAPDIHSGNGHYQPGGISNNDGINIRGPEDVCSKTYERYIRAIA